MQHPTWLRVAGLAGLPVVVMAHEGHDQLSVLSGLWHPFTGGDHLMAMLVVGWLAACGPSKHRWVLPMLFLTGLVVGLGIPALGSDLAVMMTLVVLGIGVVVHPRVRHGAITIAAVAGVIHGAAHAADAGAALSADFVVGMVLSSALLHATGFAVAGALRSWRADQALPTAG